MDARDRLPRGESPGEPGFKKAIWLNWGKGGIVHKKTVVAFIDELYGQISSGFLWLYLGRHNCAQVLDDCVKPISRQSYKAEGRSEAPIISTDFRNPGASKVFLGRPVFC